MITICIKFENCSVVSNKIKNLKKYDKNNLFFFVLY